MIQEKIELAQNREHKLVLVIGKPGSGKSRVLQNYSKDCGVPILNLDQILGTSIPEDRDVNYIYNFIKGFFKTYTTNVVLLDKKHILYKESSSFDLLSYLLELSQIKTLIATWNGYIEDGKLIHLDKQQKIDTEYELASIDAEIIELEG